MSQESVEIVRRMLERWNAGDGALDARAQLALGGDRVARRQAVAPPP